MDEKNESELKKNTQIKYISSKIKHASFLEIEKSTFKKMRISSRYQAEEKQNKKSDFSLKFITIGGYINSFILIFVLFILFFRRASSD